MNIKYLVFIYINENQNKTKKYKFLIKNITNKKNFINNNYI